MAQSSESIEALIKNAFALQIAVRTTEDADAICRKNHLTFPELLAPFSQLHSQVQLKDVQGHLYSLKNVHVRFSWPQTEPLPDSKLRLMLSAVVQQKQGGGTAGSATPWFEAYKHTFLEQLKQSDHECIRSYVSVMLVVSSTHADPLSAFSRLYAVQKEAEQARFPKWLIPHLLYYHVLLHDVSEGNDTRAQENFEKVKVTYGGASSYLLQVNSRPPGASDRGIPDPWGQFVSSSSHDEMDEVDGPFRSLKLKLKSKNKTKHEATEQAPNNSSQQVGHIPVAAVDPNLLKPNVREEAKLIDTNSDEELSSVATGDDPLSQIAARSADGIATATGTPSSRGGDAGEPNSDAPGNGAGVRGVRGEGGEGGRVKVGHCLSLEDHNQLRAFTQEFVAERLLPHLETVLKSLNDWLLSRRSVRRSFSHMSSRLMKMLGGSASNNVVSDEPYYAHTSIEWQLRTLADIAFMLQSYELAFQSYHTVKKDFQGASAWFYYAGAMEMCALSAYLLSSTRREVVTYLEEASSVYTISCKQGQFSLRASLFLSEILKERGMFRELTQLFIKMTAEDADLRSAVCLEQASFAFLRIKPVMARKHALHLILAGHRYAKAAQRVHSTRAYKQALEIYKDKGWTLAEDYIHFSLGRHSYSLHRLGEAQRSLQHLLSHRSPQSPTQQLLNLREYIYVHKQLLSSNGEGSGTHVRLESPSTTQTFAERMSHVPRLPVPFIAPQLTRVTFATAVSPESLESPLRLEPAKVGGRFSSEDNSKSRSTSFGSDKDSNVLLEEELQKLSSVTIGEHMKKQLHTSKNTSGSSECLIIGASDYDPARLSVSGARWEGLEMRAASGVSGVLHENFTPSTLVVDHSTNNSSMPLCTVNEPVAVCLHVSNPLRVLLVMSNVALVWSFTPSSSSSSSSLHTTSEGHAHNSLGGGASCEVLPQVVLQPEEQRMLTLHITPLKQGGELQVLGVVYNLCVDGSLQQKGSESPVPSSSSSSSSSPPTSRSGTLPSMAVSSRDSLYQKQVNSSVQQELVAGIQGVVELAVRGPRLNDNKLEKASVVYGHDYRLRWTVNSPMPKLAVCLLGVRECVLSGELCRVGVEVFNCGQVALNSLRVTSSLAHSLLLELDSSVSRDPPVYPTSKTTTITPSPPPASTPSHPHTSCLEIPLPHGRLNPGEGVTASLVLQAGGGALSGGEGGEGGLPWDLVFYYEPAIISASSRISHRVLRHSLVLKVRECLKLRASATHGQLPSPASSSSGFDMNQLIITLDAENRYQSSSAAVIEVRVMQVSCVSASWEASRLDCSSGPGGVLSLLPSEVGVVQLKVSRLTRSSSGDTKGGGEGVWFSDVPLGDTTILSRQFPAGDLFRGSEVCGLLLATRGRGRGRGRGEEPDHNSSSSNTGSPNSRTEDIALIVFWQALVPSGSDTVYSYGHHTLTVALPQSLTALTEEPTSRQSGSPYDLVKYYLEHPVTHHHGFTSPALSILAPATPTLCQIPVQVVLQNCCQSAVQVVVELLQPRDSVQHDQRNPRQINIEPNFFWSGGTCRRHMTMAGNSTKTLTVFANFCQPGTYNLNSLRVSVAREGTGSSMILQRWQRTSYLIVD